jgi:hypothetical protein
MENIFKRMTFTFLKVLFFNHSINNETCNSSSNSKTSHSFFTQFIFSLFNTWIISDASALNYFTYISGKPIESKLPDLYLDSVKMANSVINPVNSVSPQTY